MKKLQKNIIFLFYILLLIFYGIRKNKIAFSDINRNIYPAALTDWFIVQRNKYLRSDR